MFIYVSVPLQYASARCEDVKSFVDDLSLGQGVVLSRAASTLRSIETQPFDRGFVRIRRAISFRFYLIFCFIFFVNFPFSFNLKLFFSKFCRFALKIFFSFVLFGRELVRIG